MQIAAFTLKYFGSESERSVIDLYDVAEAMIGFQRSLAITTHFVLNGEVITQSPALKGARILSLPPQEGSWKATAIIVTGIYTAMTTSKETPAGHLIRSAYDYVVSQSLGFHVDYDKTLGQQYEEYRRNKVDLPYASEDRFDGVIEKCEAAIKNMHRPIVWSETADKCKIESEIHKDKVDFNFIMNNETYLYINTAKMSEDLSKYSGRISSYNINTYKGRVYVGNFERTIPFDLSDGARDLRTIAAITDSLQKNAIERMKGEGEVEFTALRNESSTGLLKQFLITSLSAKQS